MHGAAPGGVGTSMPTRPAAPGHAATIAATGMIQMYQGSEAYRLDASEGALTRQGSRPSFEVVEGRGLDARARQGLSPRFVARLRAAAVVAFAIMALAAVRVGVLAATVSLLSENTGMRTELKDARSASNELKIEESVLGNSQRIERIATKAYGMVPASSAEQMSAGSTAAPSADDASGDSASSSAGEATASSDDSTADSASSDASTAVDDATTSALASSSASAGDGSSAGANAADVDSLS